MAQYRTTIRTKQTAHEAFAFMSDLRNFERWDPGVQRSVQVTGDGGGPDATFDVVVNTPGKGLTLRYATTEYEAPDLVVVRASSRMITSLDRIEVQAHGDDTLVTYVAELRLNGPLRVFDFAVRPVFDRIGKRADEGLQRALDGEKV